MSLFEPDRLMCAVEQDLKCSSSAVSLMNLKLRREGKKDYREQGGDQIMG